jgi:hypothetical protein
VADKVTQGQVFLLVLQFYLVSIIPPVPGASTFLSQIFFNWYLMMAGHAVAQLVEALRYKPERREFNSRWCHNRFGRTMALGSTQPLTEMSTRNISWGVMAAGA